MERAFIEYARAATLIVETIPTHRDYQAGLSAEQKRNLKANGEDILENLGKLKAALVERFERYTRAGGSTADAVPLFKAAAAMAANAQQQQQQQQRAPPAIHTAARQATADEAARWRAQREEAQRRDREAGFGDGGVHPEFRSSYSAGSSYGGGGGSTYGASSGGSQPQPQPQPTYLSSASQAAVAAATRAAASGLAPSSSSSSYSSTSGGPAVAVPMIPPPGPAPMAVPVSLSGSHSHSQAGGGALAPVPPSFARPNTDGGGYGYPSSAGVSFPQPHGEYGRGESPTSYASPASNYGASAAGASYAVPSPSSPYGSNSNSNSASHYNPSAASPHLSRTSSQYSTPAPGPMPLRAPGAGAREWEWESGESTDEEGGRPISTISYPGTGMPFSTQRGVDDLSSGMGRMGMGSDGGYILILWRWRGGKRGREGGWADCSDARCVPARSRCRLARRARHPAPP
ncbi:hypothetical protein B0H14DRAFT_1240621 [Mycena olivaceomarginata]|nr:hypothetical protein B0H14DRAFT_1240621 [Mycena olivaceomarginata]